MYKNKKLQEKYEQTLKNVKEDYDKVDKVLEELPNVCEDYVIKTMKKVTTGNILDKYKEMWFSWGCHRSYYEKRSKLPFVSRLSDTGGYFTCIYINTLALYDSHNKYGLEELASLCFYFDTLNTTFYCTDEEFPIVVEALNEWYKKAVKLACKEAKEKEKEKLLKQLEALKNTKCN